MTEWRLFPEGTVPEYTTVEFFQRHPWVAPHDQRGHGDRTRMVADLVTNLTAEEPAASMVDLGCGDGSLLASLAHLGIPMWGYDAGRANVERARSAGLDVRLGDIRGDGLEYGELVVATEVVEHLLDPVAFIAALPGARIVLSSPSAETDEWHYEHHAWAWDVDGYRELVERSGWVMHRHVECDAEPNGHNGQVRPQRFQAIAAIR